MLDQEKRLPRQHQASRRLRKSQHQEDQQKKWALDFCVSRFRTDREAQYCIEKILENVEYDTGSYQAEVRAVCMRCCASFVLVSAADILGAPPLQPLTM